MYTHINNWLEQTGLSFVSASALTRIAAAFSAIILSLVVFYLCRSIIIKIIPRIIAHTKTQWDDVLLEKKFFSNVARLAPAIVLYGAIPIVFAGYDTGSQITQSILLVYIIITGMLIIDSFFNAISTIYRSFDVSNEIPITGFIQVIKILLYAVSILLIISVILHKSPMLLLSGLGAMTAILMLIFKDSILGLIAGIQLISNKMLSRGDWLEMPKFGADGDVTDITLTTVKVQNWDKTITTIPTYALITDSFKNWRGMQKSGGRRIKRSLNIDVNTIRFCTDDMLQRYSKIKYIADYIDAKNKEVEEHNKNLKLNSNDFVNRRRLTNIGTLRAYIIAYLKNHPMINQDMTFLVRQLQPTENGLPLQIYVFCKDKVWSHYEAIQSDIFDHMLAIVPEFDLRIFQRPSGNDFNQALQDN